MKKALALLLTLALCMGTASALAEGTLTIVSPNSDGLLSIIPTFEEATGIKVTVESLGSGDAMKRISTEAENPTFDLMYGGSLANYVANKDLFQEYVSPENANLMAEYQNTLGFCTTYTIDGSVLLINTDLIAELIEEIDATYWGPEERALIDQALALTQEIGDEPLEYRVRLRLTASGARTGDTDVMLSSFAWCLAKHDMDPVRFPTEIDSSMADLMWQFKWMIGALDASPLFSRAQW